MFERNFFFVQKTQSNRMIWIGWYAMLLFLSFTWLFEIKKTPPPSCSLLPEPHNNQTKNYIQKPKKWTQLIIITYLPALWHPYTQNPLSTHTHIHTHTITQNNKQNTNWSDLNINYIFIYKFTMKSASSSLNVTELIPSLARSLPLCLNDVATLIHLLKSIASHKSLSSKRRQFDHN